MAWFSVAVLGIGGLLLRFGKIDAVSGFSVLGAGLLLAFAAAGLACIGFVMIWTEGRRGIAAAAWGFALSLAVLAWPAVLAARAVILPPLSDISTDTETPPAFSQSPAALTARHGFTPPDVPAEQRAAQTEAYPMVAPLYLDVGSDVAFEAVRKAAGKMGWQIIDEDKPGGRIGSGRLGAVARTPLLNLPEYVSVRIRPGADGTRVDVRSALRYGNHDLGSNAARIVAFLDEVSNEAGSEN